MRNTPPTESSSITQSPGGTVQRDSPPLMIRLHPGDKVNILLACAAGILRIFYPKQGNPYAVIDDGRGDHQRVDFPRAENVTREIEHEKGQRK